jgi:hypothetical protein
MGKKLHPLGRVASKKGRYLIGLHARDFSDPLNLSCNIKRLDSQQLQFVAFRHRFATDF